MSLFRNLRNAVAHQPRRSGPPPLTGFQIGLIRAAAAGRLLLDTRRMTAWLTGSEAWTQVTDDVGVLVAGRFLYYDPVDWQAPPEQRPQYVHYHPTRHRGEDVLMAAEQRKKKGVRRG